MSPRARLSDMANHMHHWTIVEDRLGQASYVTCTCGRWVMIPEDLLPKPPFKQTLEDIA